MKTQDYKENDKLVWLFTEELGKITVIVKGAKKNKSKLLSATLPFCFGDYLLYKGKNMYNLNEVIVIDSFQSLLSDFDTITYSTYLCELIFIALQEQEINKELFGYLVKCFYLMKAKVIDLEIMARFFELKLLKHTGYELNLSKCCLCGKEIISSNYINLQYFSGVCGTCDKFNGMLISYSAYSLLKYLNVIDLKKMATIKISLEVKEELKKVLNAIINNNYAKQPKSLQIFKYLK